MTIHQERTHPEFVEGCDACRLSSVTLGGSVRAQEVRTTDRQWDRDGEAYRRLRRDGLQPPHVDGSAALERGATSRYEVERGFLMPQSAVRRAEQVTADLKGGGVV